MPLQAALLLLLSWVTLWWQWSNVLISLCTYLHIMQVLFSAVAKEIEVEYASLSLASLSLSTYKATSVTGDAKFDLFMIEGQSQLLALCFWLFGCWITEYQLHANIIKCRANTECSQWFWEAYHISILLCHTTNSIPYTIVPIAYRTTNAPFCV